MTALPIKTPLSPDRALDRLVAEYGLRSIALAFVLRLFRRSRPPDRPVGPPSPVPDYLRRDLGLPPEEPRSTLYTHGYLDRTKFR